MRTGSNVRSWQLLGTALNLLVTTYSTVNFAVTIRSAVSLLTHYSSVSICNKLDRQKLFDERFNQ